MEPVRVVLVDDQRVVREGLSMLLGLCEDLEVVGTGQDGSEAVDLVERHRPAVVLMDLRMPGLDGIGATAELAGSHPEVAVVVLTTYVDDELILDALRAGARGYLTKDAGVQEIRAAVHAAAAGQAALAPEIQVQLLAALRDPRSGTAGGAAPATSDGDVRAAVPAVLRDAGLTAREEEVALLIADGMSNREIAARLHVSEATVKTHVNRLFAKTHARDRAHLVALIHRR